MSPDWLRWAQRIQAIAQTGLAYTKDPYDEERFQELRQIAVEMAAVHLNAPIEQVVEAFALGTGYPTPKVDVRAVIHQEGKLLLVQESMDGCWSLPGGWADQGTAPSEMVAREVREESGYEVRPVRLLAVHQRERHGLKPLLQSVWTIYVQCELTGGAPTTSIETEAVGWFDLEHLPPLSTMRTNEGIIRRMGELVAHPDWPAEFD